MSLPRFLLGLLLVVGVSAACQKAQQPIESEKSAPNEPQEGMPRRSIETATAPSCAQEPAPWPELTAQEASRLVKLSLECADKEYPNKPSQVLDFKDNLQAPSQMTPAFFGCFDWHSSVHGHWTMATILRLFPNLPEAPAIQAILASHLTAERIAKEKAFVEEPRNATWERPYGWGWLLRLQAELSTPCGPGESCPRTEWARNLMPLSKVLRDKFITYLQRLSVPVRDGTHSNTAFAMVHAWEYARVLGDSELATVLRERALVYYGKDKECPVHFEPSGEDFLSACLAEAHLMSLVMPPDQFRGWVASFLPSLQSDKFAPLRTPPTVLDLKDPRIGHLIGLSFHRATAFQALSGLMPPDQANNLRDLAVKHLRYGEEQVRDSGYGGAHWLASFNLLAYLASPGSGASEPGRNSPAQPGIPSSPSR